MNAVDSNIFKLQFNSIQFNSLLYMSVLMQKKSYVKKALNIDTEQIERLFESGTKGCTMKYLNRFWLYANEKQVVSAVFFCIFKSELPRIVSFF